MTASFDSGSEREHDRFCVECEYNLRGLPYGSPCPECGEPTVREQDDVTSELPERAYQGRVLVDRGEAFTDPKPSRGSTRRPACSGCGYDFTGLPSAGRCPECGRPYSPTHRPVAPYVQLLPESTLLSAPWRTGALLAFISVIAYTACSLFSLYWAGLSSTVYALAMVVITGAWAVGIWFMLPASLETGPEWRTMSRRVSRVSQFAWPLSMISTWAGVMDVIPAGSALVISTVLDLVAFTGFILIMVALGIMLRDMGMRFASKRLVAGMWILLPAGLLAMVMPVPTIAEPGFTLAAGRHVVIIMLILLLPHYTIAVIMILTLFDLVGYGHWAVRYDRSLADRPERIAAKKAAMDGDGEWGVAPDEEDTSMPPEPMEHPARPVVPRDDDTEDDAGDIPLA
jgi:hypothetical protein